VAAVLDDILARLGALPEKDRAEAETLALAATAGMCWIPSPGPQTEAYFSRADVLLYGGQGGGGKTDLLLGLGLTAHRRSLIMRRKYANLSGILARVAEISGRDGLRAAPPPRYATGDGRLIEFGAAQYADDVADWQGQPHDLLGLDEATQFLKSQVQFLMGWVRSTDPAIRCRTVLATNPPLSAEGEWVIGMFRPWLDLTHPKPARPGELRWFITAPDGSDLEVPDARPVELEGKVYIPRSRTFIPSALSDNPYLIDTGYQAQLDALPEPLRSAVRDGNFMLARQDDPWQVIPSAWIRAAQERWTPDGGRGQRMTAVGLDVAQGGSNQTVLSPRHGTWFAEQGCYPGRDTPDGPATSALVIQVLRDGAQVHIDMGGGYGQSVLDHLTPAGVRCKPMVPSGASHATTRDGSLRFVNARAEWWWRLREGLDPDNGENIALPPDSGLAADLAAPRWELKAGGRIQIEGKPDLIDRLGRSPDKGDAAVLAWAEEPIPPQVLASMPTTYRTAPVGQGRGYNPHGRYGGRR
jgi:hypothetical protein